VRFQFATAQSIEFGAGAAKGLAQAAQGLMRRPLLVCGGHPERWDSLLKGLGAVPRLLVPGEPDIALAQQGAELARREACDGVVALGGGAALDAGKAVAALAANPGDPLRFLEVIGQGLPLERPALPLVVAPTTAGTGSEATRNAVLLSPERKAKVSLRHASMLPALALVDPELTLGCPPGLTAASGMDALVQVLEPYVCRAPNPLTQGLAEQAMGLAGRALRQAYLHGDDLGARTAMAFVSLAGGISLANARLGAVHGLAAPLGGLLGAPHGALCARLLPAVLAANISALAEQGEPGLERHDRAARLLCHDERARAQDLPAWANALARDLRIPGLAAWGLEPGQMAALCQRAASSSSMQGNPALLSQDQLLGILRAAL
jgi:alcohol dehydrogenase class IV